MTPKQWNTWMNRRQFLLGTAAISASALLAACQPTAAPSGGSSAAPAASTGGEASGNWLSVEDLSELPETTIRYWYYETPERIELGKQQEAAFEEMHPNISVEGSTAPESVDNEMLVAFIKAAPTPTSTNR